VPIIITYNHPLSPNPAEPMMNYTITRQMSNEAYKQHAKLTKPRVGRSISNPEPTFTQQHYTNSLKPSPSLAHSQQPAGPSSRRPGTSGGTPSPRVIDPRDYRWRPGSNNPDTPASSTYVTASHHTYLPQRPNHLATSTNPANYTDPKDRPSVHHAAMAGPQIDPSVFPKSTSTPQPTEAGHSGWSHGVRLYGSSAMPQNLQWNAVHRVGSHPNLQPSGSSSSRSANTFMEEQAMVQHTSRMPMYPQSSHPSSYGPNIDVQGPATSQHTYQKPPSIPPDVHPRNPPHRSRSYHSIPVSPPPATVVPHSSISAAEEPAAPSLSRTSSKIQPMASHWGSANQPSVAPLASVPYFAPSEQRARRTPQYYPTASSSSTPSFYAPPSSSALPPITNYQ
jgi:hypothetical protein